MNSFEFDFHDLEIDAPSIGRLLGYGEGNLYNVFSDLIRELLGNASRVCSVKAEYRIFHAAEWNDKAKTVTLTGVVFRLNDIVYKQLGKAESIAIFVCTAGPEVEKLARQAMEDGDPLACCIYDIIGSAIAEGAARLLHDKVRKAAELMAMNITNRYSPGYCGWDVSDQYALFALMPDNSCGVSLNDSALMSPEKSVSGMIGIGRDVSFDPYPCSLCHRTECLFGKPRRRQL